MQRKQNTSHPILILPKILTNRITYDSAVIIGKSQSQKVVPRMNIKIQIKNGSQ